MTGRTIATVILVVLIVVMGIVLWDRGDNDLAGDLNPNATTTENVNGIGGPDDENFDPLDVDTEMDDEFIPEKG